MVFTRPITRSRKRSGPVEFRLDGFYGRSDGQRDNSAYDQWQSNLYVGYRPTEDHLIALDFHAGQFEGGDPGRLTIQQFNENQNQSTGAVRSRVGGSLQRGPAR